MNDRAASTVSGRYAAIDVKWLSNSGVPDVLKMLHAEPAQRFSGTHSFRDSGRFRGILRAEYGKPRVPVFGDGAAMRTTFAKKDEAVGRARKRGGAILGILLVAIAWAVCSASHQAEAATMAWNGVQWNVKSGTGRGPGVNNWSTANAFVDADGDLHLAITNVNGTWWCGEVYTDATFGFGTFQWQVKTAVDSLDPNVVLGMIVYGPPVLGPDGTHEIDIEYSRFGSAGGNEGRWTVFPNVIVTPPLLGRMPYGLVLGGDLTTTSRFTWSPTSVTFATLEGFQPLGSNTNVANSWVYQPTDPTTTISQSPMPVHMNLWLLNGAPPANGQGTEVVIHSFSVAPATASAVPAIGDRGVFVLAACLIGIGLLLARRSACVA